MSERGTVVIVTSWPTPDGSNPPSEDHVGLHRFAGRQPSALGITLCGIEQKTRSEPWFFRADDDKSDCDKCEALWRKTP